MLTIRGLPAQECTIKIICTTFYTLFLESGMLLSILVISQEISGPCHLSRTRLSNSFSCINLMDQMTPGNHPILMHKHFLSPHLKTPSHLLDNFLKRVLITHIMILCTWYIYLTFCLHLIEHDVHFCFTFTHSFHL